MGAKGWRRHAWWGLLDRQPPERKGKERAWAPNRGSKARTRCTTCTDSISKFLRGVRTKVQARLGKRIEREDAQGPVQTPRRWVLARQ